MAVTTAAVTGIVTGLGSAGMSFAQAAKQKKLAAKAAADQKKLMAEARQKAEKNFYENLNVPLDAFGEQFRQTQQAQQQGLEALQQGDARQLAAGVGSLQAATAQAQEQTRIGMQDAIYENEKMKAEAKDKINQDLKAMDVGAAADAAMMQRDAEQAEMAAIQSGIQGVGQAIQSGASLAPLYGKSGGDARASKLADSLDVNKIYAEAGGQISREQIIDKIAAQNFTGEDTRGFLKRKNPTQFDYSIFQGLYSP